MSVDKWWWTMVKALNKPRMRNMYIIFLVPNLLILRPGLKCTKIEYITWNNFQVTLCTPADTFNSVKNGRSSKLPPPFWVCVFLFKQELSERIFNPRPVSNHRDNELLQRCDGNWVILPRSTFCGVFCERACHWMTAKVLRPKFVVMTNSLIKRGWIIW